MLTKLVKDMLSPDFLGQTPIDPRDFGAGGNGTTDDTAAMQGALTLSKTTGRVIQAPGVYRIDGTLDPIGATIVSVAQQYSRESLDISDWGMVLQHNNPTGPMFVPTGGSFRFENIVIQDPYQVGGTPVTRPPVIDITGAYHAVDVDIISCVILNAYDFVHGGPDAIWGDWRIKNNRGYIVNRVYHCEGAVPEVVFSTDNIWSPGVWQAGSIGINDAELAKWTGKNGCVLHVDCPGKLVEGWKSNNDFHFGYFNVIKVTQGLLNVSTFEGYSWDQCAQPIRTEGSGGIVATFGGASKAYCNVYGDPAMSVSAIYLHGTGVINLMLDFQGQLASGRWFDIRTVTPGTITIDGSYQFWGAGTASSNVNFADIEAPNIHLVVRPKFIQSNKPDQVGLNIADIRSATIDTLFMNCVRALDIGDCITAYKLVDRSLVIATGGDVSYTNTAGSKFVAAGTYDKP